MNNKDIIKIYVENQQINYNYRIKKIFVDDNNKIFLKLGTVDTDNI